MTFTYQPISEAEAEKARGYSLLDHGMYEFHVMKAEGRPSKTNNPMIELVLNVLDKEGKEHVIFDYLVATEKMNWKIRHFCRAVGLEKEYDEGKFNELLCAGRGGHAMISKQAGKQKPDGSFYKDKNVVDDYVVPLVDDKKFVDSDVPF